MKKLNLLEDCKMKQKPKAVYILVDNAYVQISYAEFCRLKETVAQYSETHWFIPMQGMLMEVSRDEYRAFYKIKERERYLKKLERTNIAFSLDERREADGRMPQIPPGMEEKVELHMMLDKLRQCLLKLSEEDAEFIRLYFFLGMSRKELAEKYGVHPSGINRKLDDILYKLRKMMKN